MKGERGATTAAGVLVSLVLLAALVFWLAQWQLAKPGPEPGSDAAMMCDVTGHHNDPNVVNYGGTRYDTDCLLNH